ncbi:MAG: bifunctional folylpolyglutamate synthase/dihydrofolate synthase, partial [Halofilum sp. (in: g-proteobacteria)]|nr:bifunctional folylpolyglutamate synthase/dihydrofolate synthase [Halofilum sp. (in: g-proteobacteria)]
MTGRTLAQWLEWIEGLHPTAIDLGLERVAAVAARLGVTVPRARVITVAGTNGKGSVCGLLEAML